MIMSKRPFPLTCMFALLVLSLVSSFSFAQEQSFDLLEQVESRTTRFTLDNGLTVLVYQREKAPVVSFVTYVDAGAVNEAWGESGLAHVFEHMAFKGTKTVGTNNYQAERKVLDRMDEVFNQLRKEKEKPNPDSKRIKELKQKFKKRQEEAAQYVVGNDYSKILQQQGGTGLNAATSYDATMYMVSLPANKMELWFAMESDRFLHPVLREFHKEVNVVKEEKRNRDNRPTSNLIKDVISGSYRAHPYGLPIVGTEASLDRLTRKKAKSFFETYYVPANMVVAIAGDVQPERVKDLAQKYFGRLPERPEPPALDAREPEPEGEVKITHQSSAQPALIYGYHAVSAMHPDYLKLQLLSSILGNGRTSRLHRELVQEKQLAMQVQTFIGWPGKKYRSLFSVLAMNNANVETDELRSNLNDILSRVREEGVKQEELERAKTKMKASFLKGLKSNSGMAEGLAEAETLYGDWQKGFKDLKRLKDITSDDIQQVAQKYLKEKRRTVGIIETKNSTN